MAADTRDSYWRSGQVHRLLESGGGGVADEVTLEQESLAAWLVLPVSIPPLLHTHL